MTYPRVNEVPNLVCGSHSSCSACFFSVMLFLMRKEYPGTNIVTVACHEQAWIKGIERNSWTEEEEEQGDREELGGIVQS